MGNYQDRFLEKLANRVEKVPKKASSAKGALRAALLPAIFCTFYIFLLLFPKNRS